VRRVVGVVGLLAAAACSKETPRPTEAPVVAEAGPAASAPPPASASAPLSAEPEPTASASTAPPASTAARVASTPGTSTRLLDAGQAPRRTLRYAWHLDRKEQLVMDLRTAASTEFAGAKQAEVPLPPVHIVLDLDPQSLTPSGDLRFAWRVSAATVTSDALTPSQITEGMRAEVAAIEHLAGTAAVTARGLSGGSRSMGPRRSTQARRADGRADPADAPRRRGAAAGGGGRPRGSLAEDRAARLQGLAPHADRHVHPPRPCRELRRRRRRARADRAPQALRAPGMASGAEARMESMLASGDGKTHFDLSRLVPQTKFTGTTTMVVSGPSGGTPSDWSR